MAHLIRVYDYLYFRFPKELNKKELYNNFIPTDYFKTPFISSIHRTFRNLNNPKKDDFYYKNWFYSAFYELYALINNNIDIEFMTNISLIHLNEESDGDINKTFITYA